MRRGTLWALLAAVSLLGALLACGRSAYPGFNPNPTPPVIHAPGLQLAEGLNRLRELGYDVTSAPFQQQGGPKRILLNAPVVDGHNGLDIANLDGTGIRQVVKDQTCTGQASVTRDGMWAICRAMSSLALNSYAVEVISLNPAGPPQHHALRLDRGVSIEPGFSNEELAISPDGAYLAALTHTPNTLCAIAIYELTSGDTQAPLATTLTSDMFNLSKDSSSGSDQTPSPSQLLCSITRFDWSSDGARLFVATRRIGVLPKGADPHGQIFVAALISSGTRVASLPVASFIAISDPNILAPAPLYVGLPQYVWNPVTGALAFAQGGTLRGNDPGMLMEYQRGDQQARALFTMPYAGYPILNLVWTGDGSRLLVGIGGLLCGDCREGVQTWYLYTPAGA